MTNETPQEKEVAAPNSSSRELSEAQRKTIQQEVAAAIARLDISKVKSKPANRLNSNTALALTAVAALAISLITFVLQLHDRAAAEHKAAIATQKERMAFADHIVSWWTTNSNGLSVNVHIANYNALPVDTWVIHFPRDNQLAPGSYPFGADGSATSRLTSSSSPAGPLLLPPFAFIGEIPPCTVIEAHAPLSSYKNLSSQVPSSLVEGDTTFVDPSGYIWAKSPSGILRRIEYSKVGANYNLGVVLLVTRGAQGRPIPWTRHARSPICA
jgi:hypothetical protein